MTGRVEPLFVDVCYDTYRDKQQKNVYHDRRVGWMVISACVMLENKRD